MKWFFSRLFSTSFRVFPIEATRLPQNFRIFRIYVCLFSHLGHLWLWFKIFVFPMLQFAPWPRFSTAQSEGVREGPRPSPPPLPPCIRNAQHIGCTWTEFPALLVVVFPPFVFFFPPLVLATWRLPFDRLRFRMENSEESDGKASGTCLSCCTENNSRAKSNMLSLCPWARP